MISNRTKLSLCQYLDMHALEFLELLFPKHGLTTGYPMSGGKLSWIQDLLNSATPEQIHSLIDEILRTQGDLRSRISPKYKHDERWDDLIRCLTLDGYKVKGKSLTAVDPTVEGAVSFEDDLSKELARSGLADSGKILQMLEKSASAFRATPPNHNDCLNSARIALETLARSIAKARTAKHPGSYDETKWGQILTYLRTSGLISENEEKGLAGVYTFVSPGSHTPLSPGFSEDEMTRLGRSLTVTMCYFLIKRYNGI